MIQAAFERGIFAREDISGFFKNFNDTSYPTSDHPSPSFGED